MTRRALRLNMFLCCPTTECQEQRKTRRNKHFGPEAWWWGLFFWLCSARGSRFDLPGSQVRWKKNAQKHPCRLLFFRGPPFIYVHHFGVYTLSLDISRSMSMCEVTVINSQDNIEDVQITAQGIQSIGDTCTQYKACLSQDWEGGYNVLSA